MKEQKSLISVIIPVYKVEPYLRKCIDSVLAQTYTNLEIILVDDGSPDNCGAICDEYAALDERIVVIHKDNGGLSSARNAGIEICTGEYINFIDSDDYVAHDYIEHLLKILLDNDADMSTLPEYKVWEGVPLKDKSKRACVKMLSGQECLRNVFYFQNNNTLAACGKLYKKGLFETIRFPEGFLFEDTGTVFKICFLCERVAVSSATKYYYVQREQSIVNSSFSAKKMDMVVMVGNLLQATMEKWPELKKAAYCCALGSYFSIFFQIPVDSYVAEKRELWKHIKEVRKTVLFDRQSRKKARAAALLSYSGMWCTHLVGRRLLRWYKRREMTFLGN